MCIRDRTYEYFEMIQDRILTFVSGHADIAYDQLKRLMLNTEMLTRDLGTVLVGEETVKEGLIDEVGGIKDALRKLYEMMDEVEGLSLIHISPCIKRNCRSNTMHSYIQFSGIPP